MQASLSNYDYPWWCPVLFVTGIISYEYSSFVFYFIRNSYYSDTIFAIVLLIYFHFFFLLLVTSYYKSIRTASGHVPLDINTHYVNLPKIKDRAKKELEIKVQWKMQQKEKKQAKKNRKTNNRNYDMELANQIEINDRIDHDGVENDQKIIELDESFTKKRKKTGGLPWDVKETSYCFKCDRVKPPRAHHCKECKTMDHHCVWIGNCVGRSNHKYFVLFLFYATTTLSIVWGNIVYDNFLREKPINKNLNETEKLNLNVCCATSFALALAIGYLFFFQMWCLWNNLTTVEYHVEEMRGENNPFCKYNFEDHLKEIFGEYRVNWLLPVAPFPEEHQEFIEYETEAI